MRTKRKSEADEPDGGEKVKQEMKLAEDMTLTKRTDDGSRNGRHDILEYVTRRVDVDGVEKVASRCFEYSNLLFEAVELREVGDSGCGRIAGGSRFNASLAQLSSSTNVCRWRQQSPCNTLLFPRLNFNLSSSTYSWQNRMLANSCSNVKHRVIGACSVAMD